MLIAHVPAGSGHEKAAQAICEAFHEIGQPAPPRPFDALAGSDFFYRFIFGRGYLMLIEKFPWLWGMMYHLTDFRPFLKSSQWLHRLSNRIHARRLEAIFLRDQPEAIVGTHFFPMEVAGRLKSQGRLRARTVSVITDFLPHALWIVSGIDAYAVASKRTQEALAEHGVAREKVHVTGIPIHPKFSIPLRREDVVRKLGLLPDRFTLLVVSGGAGTGPVLDWVKALARISQPVRILVVAGKNEVLFFNLLQLSKALSQPVHAFGFVDNMEELMEVSDLMVTKPGGLSCTEAMVKGLPLILSGPIPGQETRNASFLSSMGCAVFAHSPKEVLEAAEDLLRHPEKAQRLRARGHENSFPDAAVKIARLAFPS